jgi:hypothetical protein
VRIAGGWLALAIGIAACGSKAETDNPRLDASDVGLALYLPARMQQSLDSVAPGLRLIRAFKYRADVREAAAEEGGSGQALFAVVADFDGDGTQDVAVEGLSPVDSALVVVAILNTGSKPTAFEIGRYRNVDADAVGIYLSRPVKPKPGAFEVVNYPDASTLYFYRDGKFEGVRTGG